MEISSLSKFFVVRKLTINDVDTIYDMMSKNEIFYQYHPPFVTKESVVEDMEALPPNKSYDDKYYIGFFEKDCLVAVMDLILNFPNRETAFIGFFMMNKAFQGKGLGTEIIKECFKTLKEEGYHYVRLGFAKGNPQSEAFWLKNGFERTGVEDVQEQYTVVVLQKEL